MGLFLYLTLGCTSWVRLNIPRKLIIQKSLAEKGSYLRVHFKNTYEVAMAIKGMNLGKAQRYLNDVIDKKQAIAFRVFNGGPGRHAQGKNLKAPGGQVRWPQKSCRFVLDLLRNAESNADVKGLNPEALEVTHIQVNRAPKQRRRSYRAHGRINPYMSSPSHIEMILRKRCTSCKTKIKGKQKYHR